MVGDQEVVRTWDVWVEAVGMLPPALPLHKGFDHLVRCGAVHLEGSLGWERVLEARWSSTMAEVLMVADLSGTVFTDRAFKVLMGGNYVLNAMSLNRFAWFCAGPCQHRALRRQDTRTN